MMTIQKETNSGSGESGEPSNDGEGDGEGVSDPGGNEGMKVRLLKRLFVHMKSVMKIQDMHFTSFYLNMKMLIMSGTLSTLFTMIILHMRTGMVIKSSVRTIQKTVIM